MPATLHRKSQRSGPGPIERVVGVFILALVTGIVGMFALTSGLFAGRWGSDAGQSLFALSSDDLQPVSPPREMRVAAAMLPPELGPAGRLELAAFGLTGPQPDLIGVRRSDQNDPKTIPRPQPEAKPDAELAEAARRAGASLIYSAVYTRGKQTPLTVLVMDCGTPAGALSLLEARRPAGTDEVRLGQGGWQSDAWSRGGFRAGRYYTEAGSPGVVPEGDEQVVQAVLRKLASLQLVYEEARPAAGEGAPGAGTQETVTAVEPAAGAARFAEIPGGQILAPTKVETYTDNLYEKIDGKEGMFRAFHFGELRFGQYLDSRTQDVFDVYLFDMSEPINAFGIFKAERSTKAVPLELGREGYVSGTSIYFYKAKYYVNVLGPSADNAALLDVSRRIAEAVAGTIADQPEPFWAEPFLPDQDRVAHSLSYQATSALGYGFLNEMFIAEYESDGQAYQLFVMRCADEAAAGDVFKQFVEATAKYDTVLSEEQIEDGSKMVGESLGVFTAAFVKGIYFGGATECEDRALAEAQAGRLRDRLP